MSLYKIYNGPMPTAASQAVMATGTAIKTLMQVVPSATNPIKIKEWGISFDGSAAATPGIVECLETDVAATSLTAYVASGIHKLDAQALVGGDPTTNLIQVGTSLSGYGAGAEGTITAVRQFDAQQIAPTNQYIYQAVLGNEAIVQPGKFARIRGKFAATVNAICYMVIEV